MTSVRTQQGVMKKDRKSDRISKTKHVKYKGDHLQTKKFKHDSLIHSYQQYKVSNLTPHHHNPSKLGATSTQIEYPPHPIFWHVQVTLAFYREFIGAFSLRVYSQTSSWWFLGTWHLEYNQKGSKLWVDWKRSFASISKKRYGNNSTIHGELGGITLKVPVQHFVTRMRQKRLI